MFSELQWVHASVAGLFGLMLGSFINVVVYRLPKMLEQQWAAECAEFSGVAQTPRQSLNLAAPRSQCPHCGYSIRWFENIPVVSYLILGARCSACKTRISLRYPLVEITTGIIFFFCIWRWGVTPTGASWCLFASVLLTLALIDWDTTLLPDDLTLPLVWAGLVAAMMGWVAVDLNAAVWGAVAGYLSLWIVYWAFKLITGKEGMGYGDFKLFAALGAWFGWKSLIPMILIASIIGTVVGVIMKSRNGLRDGGYVPFGPFLATAGLTSMIVGPLTLQKMVGL